MENSGENWVSIYAPIIFLLFLAIDFLNAYLCQLKKKKSSQTNDRLKLQEEIKLLLKEANALSGPSTFAQSAKLKRQAAAKEKERERIKEAYTREEKESYKTFFKASGVFQALIFVVSIGCFWGSPIAIIAQQQILPFGKILSWGSGIRVVGCVSIGIFPWLMLSSTISGLISKKAFPVSR